MHRTAPRTKGYPSPNVSGAEVEREGGSAYSHLNPKSTRVPCGLVSRAAAGLQGESRARGRSAWPGGAGILPADRLPELGAA